MTIFAALCCRRRPTATTHTISVKTETTQVGSQNAFTQFPEDSPWPRHTDEYWNAKYVSKYGRWPTPEHLRWRFSKYIAMHGQAPEGYEYLNAPVELTTPSRPSRSAIPRTPYSERPFAMPYPGIDTDE